MRERERDVMSQSLTAAAPCLRAGAAGRDVLVPALPYGNWIGMEFAEGAAGGVFAQFTV